MRERGLTRFIAVCLLSGYAWLGAGAAILLADGFLPLIAARDAGLHAILLGFVFSMVFGHAPIIFPAVTRAAMPYHWSFYIPLVLLQASLAIRIAGDLSEATDWRRLGGWSMRRPCSSSCSGPSRRSCAARRAARRPRVRLTAAGLSGSPRWRSISLSIVSTVIERKVAFAISSISASTRASARPTSVAGGALPASAIAR